MVCLVAVMMFGLILTTAAAPFSKQEAQPTAAAPSSKLEAQREKEEEMLWRGQQVAMAINRFRMLRGGMFPTDLTELTKITEVNGKRIRLLRPSALCDPMTPCKGETNWRVIHPGDPLPKTLLNAIVATQEKNPTPVNPQSIQELARFAQMSAANLPGRRADARRDGNIGPVENQGAGSGSSLDEKKSPIIGVVSRKKGKMFRSYYGINDYVQALFFPNIPVLAGGFVNPFELTSSIVTGGGGAKDPGAPVGVINGRRTGALSNGRRTGALSPAKN